MHDCTAQLITDSLMVDMPTQCTRHAVLGADNLQNMVLHSSSQLAVIILVVSCGYETASFTVTTQEVGLSDLSLDNQIWEKY